MAKKKLPKRRKPAPSSEPTFYMLVRAGRVQRQDVTFEGVPTKVWPVAESYDDAKRLAEFLKVWSEGVRPAMVGSIENETLQGHIGMAMDEGCEFIACVAGWSEAGEPIWKTLPIGGQ